MLSFGSGGPKTAAALSSLTLVQQAVRDSDCFLFDSEDLLQLILRFCQRFFLGFASGAIFFQRCLDLFGWRIVLDGCSQGFQFRTGLTEPAATGATTATATATATAATTTAARCECERGLLGIHNLLEAILNRLPFGVIGHTHLLMNSVHPHLLELRGVAAEAATTTAAAAAAAATASAAGATTVILRHQAAGCHADASDEPDYQ